MVEENLKETDTMKNKIKAKEYADQTRHTKPNNLQIGDTVICKQRKQNKLTPKYDPVPYQVTKKNGTKITAERESNVIQRNASFFKKINFAVNTFKKKSNAEDTIHEYEELICQQNFTRRFLNQNAEAAGNVLHNQPGTEEADISNYSILESPALQDEPPEDNRPRRSNKRRPNYLQDYFTD